jgi:nucleotide-binding universal stress UspA family protein
MDDSEIAETALQYALDVHSDAEITVLHVVGEPSSMMGRAAGLALAADFEERASEYAEPVLDRAREIAAETEVEITTEVMTGHPARAILNRADSFDALVMGPHGGSLVDRLVVGNVARTVFSRSPIPVTSVR